MNTQLYQSIRLMSLPVIELREVIQEEIERNPALEVLADPAVVSLDQPQREQKEEYDYFESSSDSGFVRRNGAELSDANQQFIEGIRANPQTLQDYLLWQLHLQPIDTELLNICDVLIQNLDDDGFHKEAPETLFKPVAPQRLAEALKLVQTLDPQGSCTCNFRESLKVQLRLLPDADPLAEKAVDYLELLEKGRFGEVAKNIGCSIDEVRDFLEQIRQLSPYPGRHYSSSASAVRFIVPDIQVIKKDHDFSIILNDEEIPVLGLNPFFMKLSATEENNVAARDFARENIKEARWFIYSVNQRNHTLLRVTRAILDFQRPFFIDGPKYLLPLTLREIADELGIHEATVSRTANGKYIQTEWGIFELRRFFSRSINKTSTGRTQY